MNVGVIGLGYVGLPLAVAFAEAGHDVTGVEARRAGVDDLPGHDPGAARADPGHPDVDYAALEHRVPVVDLRGVIGRASLHPVPIKDARSRVTKEVHAA